MQRYCLEFVLNTLQTVSVKNLENSLREFGDGLQISQASQNKEIKGRDFKVRIYANDPTIIFDACAQFGRIRSIKIDEQVKSQIPISKSQTSPFAKASGDSSPKPWRRRTNPNTQ